eukprot:scaffold133656_cov31-Prasinocladus_malaysianus.AAC.1
MLSIITSQVIDANYVTSSENRNLAGVESGCKRASQVKNKEGYSILTLDNQEICDVHYIPATSFCEIQLIRYIMDTDVVSTDGLPLTGDGLDGGLEHLAHAQLKIALAMAGKRYEGLVPSRSLQEALSQQHG